MFYSPDLVLYLCRGGCPDFKLPFVENDLSVSWSAPGFDDFSAVRYQYRLLGLTETFSDWTADTRVAFTELRRRRWQDVSLDGIVDAHDLDFVPDMMIDRSAGPDEQATQRIFLETLQRLISTELTDKQRQALVAVRYHTVTPVRKPFPDCNLRFPG